VTDFILGICVGLLCASLVVAEVIRQWRADVARVASQSNAAIDGMAASCRASLNQMSVVWQADVDRLSKSRPVTRPGARA